MSPELQLVVELCRSAFLSDRERKSWEQSAALDWDHVLQLVRFHRVQGLAWHSLRAVGAKPPAEIATSLSADAVSIAAANLRAAVESRELLVRFERAGIPLLFMKGLTVGAIAYGNPHVKAAIDIDLLIERADLDRAVRLLRDGGYQAMIPADPVEPDRLSAWHGKSKESVWAKGSPLLQIDLHTRTADNPRLIPGIRARSPSQSVDVGDGNSLPTLAEEELFAYLAVHGASSAWFRLKWIADFAGFVLRLGGAEIDRLYRRSQQLGAGRAAGQALMLADSFFDVLSPFPSLRSELMRDRATRLLWRAALRLLTGEPREPTEKVGGTLTIHWTQFLLLPGVPYKLSELWRQTRRLA